jgi:predicted nucleotidyltransferase
MRITEEQINFLKKEINKVSVDAEVYLFGSRAIDTARGGDVDILVLSTSNIPLRQLRQIKCNYYKVFGWQKIDLVNVTKGENSSFLNYILPQAIAL